MAMTIPESISAIVWQMKHKWLWTVGMMMSAIGMMALMMEASCGNGVLELMAFLSCACIAFVGAMPLMVNKSNKMHYVLAAAGAVMSQVWCLAVATESQHTLLYVGWWVLGGLLMTVFRKYWCLIAEIWAIVAIVYILHL